jgi:hypothetical protein
MNAPFTIDPETGRLYFRDLSLELRPFMAEEEFIAATAKLNRDNLGLTGGWQRYSIRQLISQDRRLGIFLIFLNGTLNKLSFAYAHKDESWATWTEQGELERQKEYREELATQLGGIDTFPWGKISVVLDSKSGGTDIWINYGGS